MKLSILLILGLVRATGLREVSDTTGVVELTTGVGEPITGIGESITGVGEPTTGSVGSPKANL